MNRTGDCAYRPCMLQGDSAGIELSLGGPPPFGHRDSPVESKGVLGFGSQKVSSASEGSQRRIPREESVAKDCEDGRALLPECQPESLAPVKPSSDRRDSPATALSFSPSPIWRGLLYELFHVSARE